jgi:3-deoxy-manno-octulosonate cytidylyltransferase (CMP-KDO synthetase)
MDIYIIIPARYSSSRLPGKPLREIKGKKMIERVADIASYVCAYNESCYYIVATDHDDILNYCIKSNIPAVKTPEDCKNGTERCISAVNKLNLPPKLIINLQGDNPLCPPHVIQCLINEWRNSEADVYTPCVKLSWEDYCRMCSDKQTTPHSGTTVLVNKSGYAMAFSKQILPAIRNVDKAKSLFPCSPVRRHIGLYAYTYKALIQYISLESVFELSCIEGLEQMRFLENGLSIKAVEVDYRGRRTTSGVDNEEDIRRVEEIIDEFGEFDYSSEQLISTV